MRIFVIFGIFFTTLMVPNVTSPLTVRDDNLYPLKLVFWDQESTNVLSDSPHAPSISSIEQALKKIKNTDSINVIKYVEDLLDNCQSDLKAMNTQTFVESKIDRLNHRHQATIKEIQNKIKETYEDCEKMGAIASYLKAHGALTKHLSERPALTREQKNATGDLIRATEKLDLNSVKKAIEAEADVNPGFMGSPPLLVGIQRKLSSCTPKIKKLQNSLIEKEMEHAEKNRTIPQTIEKLRKGLKNYCTELEKILIHLKNHYNRY